MTEPHPFEYLTRQEWQVCWAIVFANQLETTAGAYPLHEYALDGWPPDGVTHKILQAVQFLATEHDYEFRGIQVHGDQDLRFAPERVESGNLLYLAIFNMGRSPNPVVSCRVALATLPRWAPGLDTEPIRQAASEAQQDLEKVLTETPKDVRDAVVAARKQAFKTLETVN